VESVFFEEEKEGIRWEGFAEKEGFKPVSVAMTTMVCLLATGHTSEQGSNAIGRVRSFPRCAEPKRP